MRALFNLADTKLVSVWLSEDLNLCLVFILSTSVRNFCLSIFPRTLYFGSLHRIFNSFVDSLILFEQMKGPFAGSGAGRSSAVPKIDNDLKSCSLLGGTVGIITGVCSCISCFWLKCSIFFSYPFITFSLIIFTSFLIFFNFFLNV